MDNGGRAQKPHPIAMTDSVAGGLVGHQDERFIWVNVYPFVSSPHLSDSVVRT